MGLKELQAIREQRGKPKVKKVYQLAKKSAKKILEEKTQVTQIVKPKKAGWFDLQTNTIVKEEENGELTVISKVEGEQEQTEKEKWFALIRTKLVGTCQCGCGQKSQKKDDMYFRHSCCHLFPKSKFGSIKYHPLNYVERAFFGGCHSVMDDTSMDRWVNFADWDDIKEKFHILAPLLTDEERASKFYSHFERLIYETK